MCTERKDHSRKLKQGIEGLGQLPRLPEPRRVRLAHLEQVPDLRAHVLDVLQVEGPQSLLVGHRQVDGGIIQRRGE